MTDFEPICPYTGLRSFSEDESLYFKGRDSQITDIIRQLEEKKFLMLTGASGDGKSSLIFAGLIPQARAGFFKAAHTNWNVVSFRPERSPLENFSRALAGSFRMDDASAVENELRHGFSSLTEIYKSTSMFLDETDRTFMGASEDDRAAMDREAGNLLVVVDQFEEFFTNPENFPNGVPSQDSRLVLNILLETVKIALRDNLPIYVVFTMRSDYIGQCAAFSGLPEFIGFSQFFVPRLQRRELQQVIEEPAVLSGNRISKRLADRLIADLEHIEDHLPILQHVLKEMWKTADSGREELDLIHYAMVGGMPGHQLPKEHLEKFRQWESGLSEQRKHSLEQTGLSNVLDIHATRLFMEAAGTYNSSHPEAVSDKEAKLIIAITFACLTRIDENRAVRNRMTLEEITGIINVPSITPPVVAGVLKPFREAGNTLIRPFIWEDGSNGTLDSRAVLDITHEALIRNWKLLNRWAATEFEYYNTFLDFKKQLLRWSAGGKSKDYLLPVGPLAYFEEWFETSRPNAWWIRRYDSAAGPESNKLKQAEDTLALSKDFLRNSASNLAVTRLFMKYGAGRIAAAAGLAVLIVVGSAFGYQRWTNRNDAVVARLLSQGKDLLKEREATVARSEFLITAERLQPGYLREALQAREPKEQLRLVIDMATTIFGYGRYSPPPMFASLLNIADSLTNVIPPPELSDVREVNAYLRGYNDLLNIEFHYLYFNTDAVVKKRFDGHARREASFLYQLLTTGDPATPWNKTFINIAAAHALTFHALPADSVAALTAALSPLEGDSAAHARFDGMFPQAETIQHGYEDVSYNGGYAMLANLYASLGNADLALRCTDTLRKYNMNYDATIGNSRLIVGSFFLYGQEDAAKKFVSAYAKRAGVTPVVYMRLVATYAGIFEINQEIRVIDHRFYNPSLVSLGGDQLIRLYELYAYFVDAIPDQKQQRFERALMLKESGAVLAKKSLERLQPVDTAATGKQFREAVHLFNTLPSDFIAEEISVPTTAGNSLVKHTMTRRQVFIYPDYINIFNEGFWFQGGRYYNDAFFKFMQQNGLLAKWYKSSSDYALLAEWVGMSFWYWDTPAPFSLVNQTYLNYPAIDRNLIDVIDSVIVKAGMRSEIDMTWITFVRMNDFLTKGDTAKAMAEFALVNWDHSAYGRRNGSEWFPLNNYVGHSVMRVVKASPQANVLPFVYRYKSHERRIVGFTVLGIAAYEKGLTAMATAYLDSATHETENISTRTEFAFRDFFDLRNPLVRLITLLKRDEGRKELLDLTGDMADKKVNGLQAWAGTYAALGQYHKAESVIPSLANANDRLALFVTLLNAELAARTKDANDPWKEYDAGHVTLFNYLMYGQELL